MAKVQEDLTKILDKFLLALQTEEDFPKLEHNFMLKTRNTLNILRKNNFKLMFNKKNLEEKDSSQIIEINHIIGIIPLIFFNIKLISAEFSLKFSSKLKK